MESKSLSIRHLWHKAHPYLGAIIGLLVLVVVIGLVVLGIVSRISYHTGGSVSIRCDDTNPATNDYLTSYGCEFVFKGSNYVCDDVCSVAGTATTQYVDGYPVCRGDCLGICTSIRNSTGSYYYCQIADSTCPEIEWSPLIAENNSGLVELPACYMDSCLYFVGWPPQTYGAQMLTIGNIAAAEELCLSFIDIAYPARHCLRALPTTLGCGYMFECAKKLPYNTQELADGPICPSPP